MQKIRVMALSISLLVHMSVVGIMSSGGWLQQWMLPLPVPAPSERKINLEFVEVPEQAPETEEEKETNVISDKTVSAKDKSMEKIQEQQARAKEAEEGRQMAKQTIPRIEKPVPRPEQKQPEEKIPRVEGLTDRPEIKKPPEPPAFGQQPVPKIPQPEYDIVSLPEVSESIFSAPEKAQLTFDAKAHKIGYYFKEVKKKIEKYWLSSLVFRYQNMVLQENEVVVSFKILPSGAVDEVSVLESSGDELFKAFCVASVVNTAPFPPLPEKIEDEIKEEGGLTIIFTFKYQ